MPIRQREMLTGSGIPSNELLYSTLEVDTLQHIPRSRNGVKQTQPFRWSPAALDMTVIFLLLSGVSYLASFRAGSISPLGPSMEEVAWQIAQVSQQVNTTDHLQHVLEVEEGQLADEKAHVKYLEANAEKMKREFAYVQVNEKKSREEIIRRDEEKINMLKRESDAIKQAFGVARMAEGQKMSELQTESQAVKEQLAREHEENERLKRQLAELQQASPQKKLRGGVEYQQGDAIEFRSTEVDSHAWFPAIITTVVEHSGSPTSTRTYDIVRLDDGIPRRSVSLDDIRPYKEYEKGDNVYCFHKPSRKYAPCRIDSFHPWPAMPDKGVHGAYETHFLEDMETVVAVPARLVYRSDRILNKKVVPTSDVEDTASTASLKYV